MKTDREVEFPERLLIVTNIVPICEETERIIIQKNQKHKREKERKREIHYKRIRNKFLSWNGTC
jgi:DUF4097 and DUF4098 domain-containing protein YvlB